MKAKKSVSAEMKRPVPESDILTPDMSLIAYSYCRCGSLRVNLNREPSDRK